MTSFSQQLQSAMTRIKLRAEAVAEQVVVDVGQSLVDKSPVGVPSAWKSYPPRGYLAGAFKGSWVHGYGMVNRDDSETIDPSGTTSMQRIKEGAKANPIGKHYISNSLPYAMRMELGYAIHAKDVQPYAAAMVHLTAIEFDQIVREAVMKVKV